MRIMPFEGAPSARLSENPPAVVGELTAPGELALDAKGQAGSVSLSSLARAVAEALAQGLPTDTGLHLDDVLTADDRLLLDWMAELTKAGGIDAREVRKLVVELVAYRRGEVLLRELAAFPTDGHLRPPSALPAAPVPADGAADARPAVLTLPTLTPSDETLARTILTSLATRDTLVDRGFVHALLDADRGSSPSVGLAFLARLVVDLSRARAGSAVDLGPSFARRDARVALAQAVATLALPTDELAPVAKQSVELGARLLRRQVPLSVLLTRNDRALLGVLYATARARGGDLTGVDNVARALIALRESERAEAQPPVVHTDPAGVTLPEPNARLELPVREVPVGELSRSVAPRSLGHAENELGEQPVQLERGSDFFALSIPRNFGSATQIAAKLAGSYGSLVPQSDRYRAAPSSRAPAAASFPGLALLAHAQGAGVHLPQLAPPLNLVQALGLGGLLAQLHTQLLRLPRMRRRERKARRGERTGRSPREDDLDELTLESRPRRGVRWELLARRRRSRRAGSVLQT